MPRPSYKAELLASRLGLTKADELPGKLRELRGEGESLRQMATRLSKQTGVEVGHTWLLRYLADHP